MVWRALTRLPLLVTELIALQREANSLTRELLALLGRPAQTPATPPSAQLHPLVTALRMQTVEATPRKRKLYTDRDVSFHTREDDLELQQRRAAAQDPRNPPMDENSRPMPSRAAGRPSSPVPQSPAPEHVPVDEDAPEFPYHP
jgi:hypothetical protein